MSKDINIEISKTNFTAYDKLSCDYLLDPNVSYPLCIKSDCIHKHKCNL